MSTVRAFCVGLTGGIGSGKSAVAEIFARLGAEVIDTDVIAHGLTAVAGAAMPAIINAFGTDVAKPSGALDRTVMRKRIFSEPDARKRLETILHPMIRAESARRLQNVTAPYAVLVVPLLVENLDAYQELIDRIAVVDCESAQQIARTAQRPGLDFAQAEAILAAQTSQLERLRLADDVINNRGELTSLDRQVGHLHADYLLLAAEKKG